MGLFDDIKARLVRKEVNAAIAPIDTEQERQAMAEEAKKNGVPPWLATVGAAAAGLIVAAVQDVANGGNLADLLSHPKQLAAAVLAAVLFRIAHSLTPPAK